MNVIVAKHSSPKHEKINANNSFMGNNIHKQLYRKTIKTSKNNNKTFELNVNNEEENPPENDNQKEKPSEDEHSIGLMNTYKLGFNKCEKEIQEEEEEAAENEDEDNPKRKKPRETPRKKKKKKKEAVEEEEDDEEEEEDEEKDENDRACIYNVWVPDCMRAKKDFIECQQIDMQELDTKEKFENEFANQNFYNSIPDYEDFKLCSKTTTTKILAGVEAKFEIDIDVSDSFYSLTGAKLRAYSFQGPNRNLVFSGFSYFKCSWTQDMAINTVMDYDILFQPDDWYYNVIQADRVLKPKPEDDEEEENEQEATNVSNKICLKDDLEQNNFTNIALYEDGNSNQNRLDTFSELETVENGNNDIKDTRKRMSSKSDNILNLCMRYLKLPKINFKKLLFSSFVNKTESLSCILSNSAKLLNENNNKNLETVSICSSYKNHANNTNYMLANFLLDSFNKPIPIWVKIDSCNNFDKLSDLRMIKKCYLKNEK